MPFPRATISRTTIRDYLTITSGVLGRLGISVVYFLIVANVLSLAEFGVFAAASAVGLVLSRLLAFGFISPVYRIATTKPRLLGAYAGGLLALGGLSLPLLVAAAVLIHAAAFAERLPLLAFLVVIAAEVLGWRVVEFVVIALNGLSRFGRAASLVVLGSGLRAAAAVAFLLSSWRGIEAWIMIYAAANLATLVVALAVFAPRRRLRFRPRLYGRRMHDALAASGSELTFYVQSELDKLLVLGLAGDRTAGLYAIAMRIVDLTAVPVRSFNQLLVQRLMRDGAAVDGLGRRAAIEGLIALVSTGGLLAIVAALWLQPALLGRNVAEAAPYLALLAAVPALRNLVEYQNELLYARGLVWTRAQLLVVLAVLKLGMMAALLTSAPDFGAWAARLNAVFLAVYAVSAAATYGALARSRK